MSYLDNSNNETGFKIYHNETVISTIAGNEGMARYHSTTLQGLTSCQLYTIKLPRIRITQT